MRKIVRVGLVLVVLLLLDASFSASTYALTFTAAKYLVNGAGFVGVLAVEVEGEALLENVLNGASYLCSGRFVGTIEENGTATVERVLNLAGTEISEKDPAAGGITCTAEKTCEGTGIEVNPVNLPYVSHLELDVEDGKFYLLVGANAKGVLPADAVKCLVLGITINELCEASPESFGEVFNAATDVEGLGASTPLGRCGENSEDGLTEAEFALATLTGGGTLSVSE
jgi:hypothetical protein